MKIVFNEGRKKHRAGKLFRDICYILRPALLSNDYEIAKLGIETLTSLSEDLFAGDLTSVTVEQPKKPDVFDRAVSRARDISMQRDRKKKRQKGEIRQEIRTAAWSWLISIKNGGLSAIQACLAAHTSLCKPLGAFAEMCSRGFYEEFWLKALRVQIKDPTLAMDCAHKLLTGFATTRAQRRLMSMPVRSEKGVLVTLIDNAVGHASGRHSGHVSSQMAMEALNARHVAVDLLSQIWICFPEFVCDEKNVDISKSILRALRRSSRTESFSLSVVSLTNQFQILESLIRQNVAVEISKGKSETDLEEAPVVVRVTKRFARLATNLLLAEQKRNYRGTVRLLASYVYKMLVITYIESHGNEHLREYLCENFMRVIKKFPDLPIGVLIGPLVRQLSLRGVSFGGPIKTAARATNPTLPTTTPLHSSLPQNCSNSYLPLLSIQSFRSRMGCC